MRNLLPRPSVLVALLVLLFLGVVVAGLASGWRHQIPPPSAPDPAGEPWFADITQEAGLDFVHDAGPVGNYFMPQSIGSGAAVFDFTADGGIKYLYLLHNGGPQGKKNQLFERQPSGRFRDVSAGSGLDIAGYNMGVAVGDVNNDGRPDILITQYTGAKLFLNNGDGTFADITEQAGLSNPAWGVSAAFFDYDRDGWLDLILVNYVDYDPTWPCPSPSGAPEYCGPKTFSGHVSKLFHNLGPAKKGKGHGVRFEDVTIRAGLAAAPGPGLGVVCVDVDGDGWPDIFVANDGQANRLWMNQHDGTFREESIKRGVAFNGLGTAQAGMGVALGDVDGDGLLDLYITHMPDEGNTLWRQGPRGLFVDHTTAAGLATLSWRGTGFGTVMADFDHNGGLDIAAVNGRIAKAPMLVNPDLGPHWGYYAERNQLFANDGKGRFRDVSPQNPALSGTANVARGLVCADFDGDGAPDLLVTTIADRARLLRNVAPHRGHWLMVRTLDPALKRDVYGALVRVRAAGRQWVRLVNPAGSYLCSGDVRAHFGLGAAERVDALEVIWPDGTVEVFPGGSADRQVVLNRGAGKRVDGEGKRSSESPASARGGAAP